MSIRTLTARMMARSAFVAFFMILSLSPDNSLAQGTPISGDSSQFLAVADPLAETLHFYTSPELEPIGHINDIVVQTHAGLLPMPDGSLLFIDERSSRLMAVGISAGTPNILHEVAVPQPVSHIAVDPDATYAVVGSSDISAPITIIDLASWESTTVALPDTGEVGVALSSEPVTLYHRNDVLARVESYLVSDLLDGSLEPMDSVEIGTGGHGESIDPETGLLYVASDEGVDVIQTNGPALEYVATYAWDTDSRTGGRGYFQRLTADGNHVVSYTADRAAPETEWTTWANDLWLADTTTGQVIRTELGPGYVYRFGLSDISALFYRIGAEGDEAITVDLDSNSETFGTVTSRIPLSSLSNGPIVGTSPWEYEFRTTGITPDGATGFVTAGGDGRLESFDLTTGDPSLTVNVGTSLSGGGAIAVFGPSARILDTIGR